MGSMKIPVSIEDVDLKDRLLRLTDNLSNLMEAYARDRDTIFLNPSIDELLRIRAMLIEYINSQSALEFISNAQAMHTTGADISKGSKRAFEKLKEESYRELGQLNGLLYLMQWQSESHN
jgi:hypothetical protein